MVSGRNFVAGAKMWAVLSAALAATLVTLHLAPVLSGSLTPSFGYVAAVLSVSERAEATLSKVASWLLGTLAGGLLGLALMAHPAAASAPWALALVLCCAAALVGSLGGSRFRVAITLTLTTLGAIALCQYCPTCGAGSVAFFASRVLSVLGGILLAAVVSSFVAPWFASAWALELMAGAFEAAVRLPVIAYKKQ